MSISHVFKTKIILTIAILFLGVSFQSQAFGARKAYIVPLREMKEVTNKQGLVRVAKILKNRGPKTARPGMKKMENFTRFAKLAGRDLTNQEVSISYVDKQGKKRTRSVITDDEGHVWVNPNWMKNKEFTISMPSYSKYKATPKKTSVFSVSDSASDTIYFTDHDDTTKFTGVMKVRSNKLDVDGDRKRTKGKRNLAKITYSNPYDWQAFPGSAELAHAITAKKVPMVVLTGSPAFLGEDIDTFYKINGFPKPAAIHLRNLKDLSDKNPDSSDPLIYKVQAFEKVLGKASKNGRLKTVIFDGDRGEKDPEVALALAKKYPHIKFIVGVHNITSDNKNSSRFAKFRTQPNMDFVVYDNKYEFAKLLYKNGKISKSGLDKVGKGIERESTRIQKAVRDGKIRKKTRWWNSMSRHLSAADLRANHLYYPRFKTPGMVKTLGGLLKKP